MCTIICGCHVKLKLKDWRHTEQCIMEVMTDVYSMYICQNLQFNLLVCMRLTYHQTHFPFPCAWGTRLAFAKLCQIRALHARPGYMYSDTGEVHWAGGYRFKYIVLKPFPKLACIERILLCTDMLMRKNYGFTPDLDVNHLFTQFNFTTDFTEVHVW